MSRTERGATTPRDSVVEEKVKRCGICTDEKSLDDFYEGNGSQGREYFCKPCRKVYTRNYQQKLKQEVVDAYGGRCSCCGETEICFLSIDHIYGNGNKEEGRGRGGYKFYLWLKRQGFPKDKYRLLCHNCNMGREVNGGICPHQLTVP